MRSRAERRLAGEWLCRGIALALLAWALWASTAGGTPRAGTTLSAVLDTAGDTLRDAAGGSTQLAGWSRRADLAAVHVTLDRAPGARTRDWLRALDAAGTGVTWQGDVPATAVAAEPVADPRGAVRVSVAAPGAQPVVVADAAGRIDSVVARGGGASVRASQVVGAVTARVAQTTASAPPPGRRDTRTIVVLGRAGWEAKFVAAALEEQGWPVAVRLRVAPGLAVGAIPALDTARVSAVIALDSTAAGEGAAITRFARSGGGVIVGSEAARASAFGALAAGRPGAPVPAATSFAAAVAPVTRLTLARAPLTALRADAVVLEQRRDTVLVAARRLDAGRIVQVGYGETWRWRMAGGEGSPDAHRAWWSGLVEAVAYAPELPSPAAAASSSDPAPRAALVAALGSPSRAPAAVSAGSGFDPSRSPSVYIAAALLLLAEWASRRLRGAK